MGQEIFYCSGCQTQLRSVDFEKEKAYKLLGLEAICSSCVPEALKTLSPDKLQALHKAMGGPPASTPKSGTGRVPLATPTPKSGTGRVPLATPTPKSGTGRIPLVAPSSTRRIALVDEDPSLNGVVLIGIVVAVAILVALFALSA